MSKKPKQAKRERRQIRSTQPDLVDLGAAMNDQKGRLEGALDRAKAIVRAEADAVAGANVGIVEVYGHRSVVSVVYGRVRPALPGGSVAAAREILGDRFDEFFAVEVMAALVDGFEERFAALPARVRRRLGVLMTVQEGPTQVRFGKLPPESTEALPTSADLAKAG